MVFKKSFTLLVATGTTLFFAGVSIISDSHCSDQTLFMCALTNKKYTNKQTRKSFTLQILRKISYIDRMQFQKTIVISYQIQPAVEVFRLFDAISNVVPVISTISRIRGQEISLITQKSESNIYIVDWADSAKKNINDK